MYCSSERQNFMQFINMSPKFWGRHYKYWIHKSLAFVPNTLLCVYVIMYVVEVKCSMEGEDFVQGH